MSYYILFFSSIYDPYPSVESNLLRQLVNRYKKISTEARPVQNWSEPVQVEFGLGLIRMDISERKQIITTSMWNYYVSMIIDYRHFFCHVEHNS